MEDEYEEISIVSYTQLAHDMNVLTQYTLNKIKSGKIGCSKISPSSDPFEYAVHRSTIIGRYRQKFIKENYSTITRKKSNDSELERIISWKSYNIVFSSSGFITFYKDNKKIPSRLIGGKHFTFNDKLLPIRIIKDTLWYPGKRSRRMGSTSVCYARLDLNWITSLLENSDKVQSVDVSNYLITQDFSDFLYSAFTDNYLYAVWKGGGLRRIEVNQTSSANVEKAKTKSIQNLLDMRAVCGLDDDTVFTGGKVLGGLVVCLFVKMTQITSLVVPRSSPFDLKKLYEPPGTYQIHMKASRYKNMDMVFLFCRTIDMVFIVSRNNKLEYVSTMKLQIDSSDMKGIVNVDHVGKWEFLVICNFCSFKIDLKL